MKLPPRIVRAKEAIVGRAYWTLTSHVLAIPTGVDKFGRTILRHWNVSTQEWQETAVTGDYNLIAIKEGTVKMPKGATTVTKKGPGKEKGTSKRLSAQVGITTKKNADQSWGIAFQKHGKNAKDVVGFMKKEFPSVNKKWESWVNHYRLQYNKGRLGLPAPKEVIGPYNGKRKAEPVAA